MPRVDAREIRHPAKSGSQANGRILLAASGRFRTNTFELGLERVIHLLALKKNLISFNKKMKGIIIRFLFVCHFFCSTSKDTI